MKHKRQKYHTLLNETLSDQGNWGKNLKKLENKHETPVNLHHIDNSWINSVELVNHLNEHYCSHEEVTIVEKEHKISAAPLSEISIGEVKTYLKQINTKKAVHKSDFPPWISKQCAEDLCVPVQDIVNLMFQTRRYPAKWKQGEVVPVPKNKNPKTAKDYRPITLLWHLGKVSERCMAKKYRGCVRTELLKNQYAYCAKRSTTDALIHTFEDWTKQLDMKETCHIDVAFIDFSKAFDKLQPLILVEKLINNFGMNANLTLLVKNFLTDRHQVVRYGDIKSAELPVKVGTPQGPLLWLAYAEDLQPMNVITLKYADDTTLYCPNKKDEQNNFLSNSLQQASIWSTENCMLLNEAKTQVMKIALKSDSCCPESAPDLAPNLTHTAKLLGVNIDTSLTFKEHVAISKKKCNSRLFAMRKLKQLSVGKDALMRF
jgi:hypothetical protein